MAGKNAKQDAKNPKQEFIKTCIYEATLALMATKRLDEISVTELTNKAGVSRMAFYRNYNIVQDVVIDYLNTTKFGLSEFVNDNNRSVIVTSQDVWLFISSSLTFVRENKELIRNLIRCRMTYLLINWFDEFFSNELSETIRNFGMSSEYDIAGFTGMYYEIVVVYAKGEMDDDSTVVAANAIYRVIYNYMQNMSRAGMHINAPQHLYRLENFNGLGAFSDLSSGEFARVYILVEHDTIVNIGGECSDNSMMRAALSAAMLLVVQKSTLSALTLTLDDVSAELGGLNDEDLYLAAIAGSAVKNAGIDYYNRMNLFRSKGGVECLNYKWDWNITNGPMDKKE